MKNEKSTGDKKEKSNNFSLRNYDPAHELQNMAERLFSFPFSTSIGGIWPFQNRNPLSDISESDKGYLVSVDVPGIPKESIDLQINGNMLTVRAEHNEEEGDENDDTKSYRRQYRSFSKTITLPSDANLENIEANCENGSLEIWIPKSTSSQPKKIEVKSGQTGLSHRLTESGGKKQSKSSKTEMESTKETSKH